MTVNDKLKNGSSARELESRTTEEVFMDHLALRKAGQLDEDITRNYANNVIVVSNFGTFFGHEGGSSIGPLACDAGADRQI